MAIPLRLQLLQERACVDGDDDEVILFGDLDAHASSMATENVTPSHDHGVRECDATFRSRCWLNNRI